MTLFLCILGEGSITSLLNATLYTEFNVKRTFIYNYINIVVFSYIVTQNTKRGNSDIRFAGGKWEKYKILHIFLPNTSIKHLNIVVSNYL